MLNYQQERVTSRDRATTAELLVKKCVRSYLATCVVTIFSTLPNLSPSPVSADCLFCCLAFVVLVPLRMCNASGLIEHYGGARLAAATHHRPRYMHGATLFISKQVRRPSTSICTTLVPSIMHQPRSQQHRCWTPPIHHRLSDTQVIELHIPTCRRMTIVRTSFELSLGICYSLIYPDIQRNSRRTIFWATVCKTVRPMLSDRCPVCL